MDTENSYTQFLADKLTGVNFSSTLADKVTAAVFFSSLFLSIFTNFRDRYKKRRNNTGNGSASKEITGVP
jgi:hypothetical protein